MTRINKHFAVALFFLFLFSPRAISQPTQMITDCYQLPDNMTQTSFYRSNRDTVLSTLRNHSSLGSYYSNATAGLSQNTIYGMFFCRGDINRTFCSDCVHTATLKIVKTCNSHIEAFIFYEECMVRFSNFSFFTLVEEAPAISTHYPTSSLDSPHFFNQTLPGKLDELILKASSSSPVPYFVEGQEHVTQMEGSYNLEAMVQCSPDLDPRNCTVCLTFAVHAFLNSSVRSAMIFFPKCLVRYNISALQPNGVTKGNEIFGRTFIAIMTGWVILLMSYDQIYG